MIQLHRLPAVTAGTGRSRASLYQDIADGLFPPPVKIGHQASAWPDDEVDTVNRARIAGKSEEEIRKLVKRLVEARSNASEHAAAA